MQKYLNRKAYTIKRKPNLPQDSLARLRQHLEMQAPVPKDLLEKVLNESKVETVREVLLFCRYD